MKIDKLLQIIGLEIGKDVVVAREAAPIYRDPNRLSFMTTAPLSMGQVFIEDIQSHNLVNLMIGVDGVSRIFQINYSPNNPSITEIKGYGPSANNLDLEYLRQLIKLIRAVPETTKEVLINFDEHYAEHREIIIAN